VKVSRSKRGFLVASVVVFVGLFLIRPGADRLRWRIVRSISSALGRQVQVGYVSLRFLPPGFELDNFSIHDDPAFSAEPMLRSNEVVANLRVISLIRGRLEISRLELTEPSLNLVRNADGHWNVESILERAAQTPVAPTGKSKSESRPGFPYIEADRGRINFKIGPEKKPNALADADFAVWQDSENSWGMRLKARPIRTDFNITDTGVLRANGTWQRAASLRETPVQFTMEWDQGQLGQLSKFLTGNDKGWRGTLTFDTVLNGSPGALRFQTSVSVNDFRRYDLPSENALLLRAECAGTFSTVDRSVANLDCAAPVGAGSVTATGAAHHIFGPTSYDWSVKLNNIPASSVVALVRRAKKNIPDDLTADGKITGEFSLKASGEGSEWSGHGEAEAIKLATPSGGSEIAVSRIPFSLSGEPPRSRPPKLRKSPPLPLRMELGKFDLSVGADRILSAQGWASRAGYGLYLSGDARVQKLLQVARVAGIPVLHPTADGQAKVELQIAGDWSGFPAPIATGAAQLRGIRAEIRGVNSPLQIISGDVQLLRDQIRVQNLTASLGTSTWTGSVQMPRGCGSPDSCVLQFDLRTDSVASDELARLLDPRNGKRPWYRFLSASSAKPYLTALHASGKLSANRLDLNKVVATKVSATVMLENGNLRLTDVRGNVLGGTHTGEWTADFVAQPPECHGSGILDRASMEQVAEAMHDGWITGTASAAYEVSASGSNLSQMVSSATGKLRIEVADGELPHIELATGNGALRIHRLAARLRLQDGLFDIEEGKLETPIGIFQLSGTASLGQTLNVKLVRDAHQGYSITGTLPQPKVAPAILSETRASLKP
jgi:hypothetical protein